MNPRDFIPIELLILVPLLYILYRTVRPWPLSPVWLLLGGYLSLAAAGRYALDFCSGPPGLNVLFFTPAAQLNDTVAFVLYVCIALGVGSLSWILLAQAPILPVRELSERTDRGEPGPLWTMAMLLPLVLYVIGSGPTAMLHRTEYITGWGNILKIAGGTLLPLAVAFCGAACFSSRSRLQSGFAMLIALAYFLATFAMATRMMALVPLLFALGALGARPDLRITWWLPVGALILALLLLPVPLYLRGLGDQGLIPFIHILGKMAGGLRGMRPTSMILGNILFSFPLTNYVGSAHRLPMSYFWIEVNPLPGRLVGWYDIERLFHMTGFVPYNALGELLNYGYVVAGVCYAILGVYFAHLETSIRESARRGRFLLALLLFGFPALIVIFSLQYNLRSCVRLVYYGMAFESLAAFLAPVGGFQRTLSRTGLHSGAAEPSIR